MFVPVSSALKLIVLMCAVLVLAANIGPIRPVGVRTAVELLERKRIQDTFAPARMLGCSSAHSADRLGMTVATSAYGRLPSQSFPVVIGGRPESRQIPPPEALTLAGFAAPPDASLRDAKAQGLGITRPPLAIPTRLERQGRYFLERTRVARLCA